MNVILVNKTVVESLNEMNQGNHKPNILQLKDGRSFVPAKLLNEPLYEKYQNYFDTCEQITISNDDIDKPEIKL